MYCEQQGFGKALFMYGYPSSLFITTGNAGSLVERYYI